MESGIVPNQLIQREFKGHGPGNSIHSQVQSIHEEGPHIELLEFENLVMKIGDDSDPENFFGRVLIIPAILFYKA
ncbi:hypothetical protein CK203_096865 [Vitis vinifera]|uniref:Uncharacterized protein n=1 Tax=Vitis vinifera TaxID=29760 RepID=A0A438BPQ1_VITVI|nr:hypothetical protein CK203_096865 [Vitis vinifera]